MGRNCLSVCGASLFVALACPVLLGAKPEPLVIETVAGNGQRGDLPSGECAAIEVPVDQPFGVEAGPDGALYRQSINGEREDG